MTAPIASGWSGCRVGLAPTGKRRLCTAHAMSRNQSIYSTFRWRTYLKVAGPLE
jgi:hypothetical protein